MILNNDIDTFTADQTQGHHSLTAYIHTVNDDIKVFRILSLDVVSDFVEAYGDRVTLKCIVKQSDAIRRIMQNRTNLEMTIIKGTSSVRYVSRYKAVIPDAVLKGANFDVSSSMEAGELDMGGLTMIELQGKHRFVEVAPLPTLSGTFSNISLDTILSKCIKYYMGKNPLPIGKSLDECIIAPINNQRLYTQVTVPTATPLLRLPSFLQARYGVYTGGMGSYLRPFEDGSKVWWIYPLYGQFQWVDNCPKLSVIIPSNRRDKRSLLMKNTIQREGDTISIIAQIMDAQSPAIDHRPSVRPSGFKVVDPERSLESPMDYEHGSVKVSGSDRFKHVEQFSRDDGIPLDIPSTGQSSNYYLAASTVAANSVIPTVVRWDNGINELIVPGMLVTVMYDKESRAEKGIGRVVSCYSVCTPTVSGAGNSPIFSETCILTINMESNQ